MILLLSQPYDHSTNKVIDWLVHLGADHIRIPFSASKKPILSVTLGEADSDCTFKYGNDEVSLSKVTSVWFRGGDLIDVEQLSKTEFGNTDLGMVSNSWLRWEWSSLNAWVHGRLMTKRHLGNPFLYEINKLMVLEKAKAVGLLIPETRILSTRDDIAMFGAHFDYYQVDATDSNASTAVIISALAGSLVVAAGKVVFGWVPKIVISTGCECSGNLPRRTTSANFFMLGTGQMGTISNVAQIVFCVTNLGGSNGPFRQCRTDLSAVEACKWIDTCEAAYPGNWADWTFNGFPPPCNV